LAAALAALHAAGWLHGQVRAEHAIVSPQGHATLIDLSQARRLGSDECALGLAPLLAPAYGPPEAFLARGRLTGASDIYSLGILLFELLTARRPFTATEPGRWATCHCRQLPPDVREARPGLSRDVDELVRRLLAKEPLRRPTAAELVDRLAGLEIDELL
jgi:serine/threonine-protein kinase